MAKRIKKKFGMKHCQFGKCKDCHVEAIWTTSGITGQREYACESHKTEITSKEDDGYMSMADEMTWGRL
ncbi:hypothetical protein UFOVP191_32 [uncultured Caudovirales phage]|uniref:Uncharacterized protein n=1 Tax=uncultured Caudovirales phage TaxID=2100421 RepID=A0A6J7WJH6_9CAUD|nr:hypothetical protein UFOVP191_32 [uncultured Caudovirales phage]